MNRRCLSLLASVSAILAMTGTSARAVDYFVSYDVTLDPGIPGVTNIMIVQKTQNGGGLSWAYSANGGPGQTMTTISEGFPKTEPITGNLLIGLTQGLQGFPPDQKHVVLMMSDASAALANNIAWGTLFPSTLEATLIDSIELATSGQPFEIIQPGLDYINDFIDGEGSSILGPGGSQTSTYFGLGDTFTVMAFSDGQQIGSGISYSTPVPEASTIPAAISAVGVLMAMRRRRGSSPHQ